MASQTVDQQPAQQQCGLLVIYSALMLAKDHRGSAHPACAGQCLLAWFPVTGQPAAAKGVT